MEKNEKANLIFLSDLRNDSDLLQNKKTEIISNNKQRYYIFDNFKGILIFIHLFLSYGSFYIYLRLSHIRKFYENYQCGKTINIILYI